MFPIKTIMTKDVYTVKESTPIFEALQLLKKYEVSGLPVVDEEMNLKGILTEKDVLRILIDSDSHYRAQVRDFMTRDVVAFKEDDSAFEVCQFFLNSHIRRVPICEGKKLVGIVSRRDIITLIVEAKSKISDARFT